MTASGIFDNEASSVDLKGRKGARLVFSDFKAVEFDRFMYEAGRLKKSEVVTNCHGLKPDKARTACFNSGQRIDDHFVDITEMVEVSSALCEDFKRLLRENHDRP